MASITSLTSHLTSLRLLPTTTTTTAKAAKAAKAKATATTTRLFSTSPAAQSLSSDKALARTLASVPAYPHPPSRWYKQSNWGLYANRKLRFGNTVSPKTETKNRRKWAPNVRRKNLYSAALDRWVSVKLVTRVLRSVDKAGGLDAYLLSDKPARIRELGTGGWLLRWRVMRAPVVRERMLEERRRLGLKGPAPWELGSWGEALAHGFPAELLGLSEEEAREVERGVDKALERRAMDGDGEDGGDEGFLDLHGFQADALRRGDPEAREADNFMAEEEEEVVDVLTPTQELEREIGYASEDLEGIRREVRVMRGER